MWDVKLAAAERRRWCVRDAGPTAAREIRVWLGVGGGEAGLARFAPVVLTLGLSAMSMSRIVVTQLNVVGRTRVTTFRRTRVTKTTFNESNDG